MFCPSCGREVAEGGACCSWCGQAVTQALPVERPEVRRPTTIAAAAVICGVLGGLSLLEALFLFFAAGFLFRAPVELPILPFWGVLTFGDVFVTAIFSSLIGVLYIAACGLLWWVRKRGAMLAIAAVALSIVLSVIGVFIPPFRFGLVGLLGLAVVILSALDWDKLG